MLENIKAKYGESFKTLSQEDKKITVNRMKDYIEEKQIDYIKYLDMEEAVVTEKLNRFNRLSENYDEILLSASKAQE